MIGTSEQRSGKQIEAIRAPRREQLRILYARASSRSDLRVDDGLPDHDLPVLRAVNGVDPSPVRQVITVSTRDKVYDALRRYLGR